VRLRGPAGLLGHVVRGTVKGNRVYLVPRADGEIVLGASSEEACFDQRPRAGAVYDLLRDAQSLVPELSEVEFVEVSTGLRPGSPDNAPLLGNGALPGLVLATGHYRNGILLAPVTGDEIADLIIHNGPSPVIEAFDPMRGTTEVLA
jgi:glycine oxidase